MYLKRTPLLLAAVLAASFSTAYAQQHAPQQGHTHKRLGAAEKPHQRLTLPPSTEQALYELAPSTKPRTDLKMKASASGRVQALATPECKNMDTAAQYNGSALADYIVNLPDYECTYPLYSLDAARAAKIYSPANFAAVVSRFTQEASAYNATNRALVNLTNYLRAAYYIAGSNIIPLPSTTQTTALRAPIKMLAEGTILYAPNPLGSPTAGEVLRLITNMHDEAYFLPSMKKLFARYTQTIPNTPNPAEGLKNDAASGGFTSALTVVFYAHYRPEGLAILQSDTSYPTALNAFLTRAKPALINTPYAYQLNDAANENFRFMQYAAQKPVVKPMVKATIDSSTMTGVDSGLWLAGASAVKYYDNDNCSFYGTCNYETKLADTVLKNSYTCSPTLRIRAQDMTTAQMQDSCAILAKEETYFHEMLQTNRTPVANDNNSSLELVVFDDYANYNKYAGIIYDMATDNGGMYLEGDPSVPGNQARFVAHEASWLRPAFSVWNLEHEYVHYLDGRFDMKGDFGDGTVKPTVWWIEGIAEYLSLRNNNQKSIDAALTGQYPLSTIFGNTYSMGDYTNRAYRWGYMATRFMMEKHRSDVDTVVAKFRVGDYDGYQNTMNFIGTRYDSEFAAWVKTATITGEPPLPVVNLPACASNTQLGKNCSISGWTSSGQAYAYLLLPAGAKNLRLFTNKGTGDVDLYVGQNFYPTTTSYTGASTNTGNSESISIAAPVSGQWYYIVLKAKQAFSGVTLNATYD
jgi:microbial collagenase